ncbi:hypothetical protein [Collinsella stercoris]|uniref:hypothetical protein n=1 Tax=Collinsella stercoris TaxID=147206 RepID=UPI0026EB1D63|nr:hypothetical protein [Collinsella stercoris]MBS6555464.1 hypothetical protein [Collinsella stercoris]
MRILLMAPTFFGYRDRVRDELSHLGHDVECVDDRPSESVSFKSLAKISYRLIDRQIAEYAMSLREKVAAGEYDLLLFMGGMSFCFTHDQFSSIKSASNARFVAYLWDAFNNCERFGACRDLFDIIYSFEPSDCERYGLKLRPLFFSGAYDGLPLVPVGGFTYDACFIGSVHQPSKFEAISSICDNLESRGLRVFRFFFMPSKSAAALRRLTNPAYRGVEFSFESLPAEKVAEIYARSKAIIDSPQAGQYGLTMRTLETIGAHRKLITANPDAVLYDFASRGDVAVWRGEGSIPPDFFETPYRVLPDEVYRGYSIETFVRTLLGDEPAYEGYEKGN